MPEQENQEFTRIGENLKRIRTQMGYSLNDVAAKTGVSKTMISQIERADSIPTIATAWKLANGLKIKFESLLTDSAAAQHEVKNITDLTALEDDNGRFVVYCLYPFSPLNGMELFYGIMKPGCCYTSEMHKNSGKDAMEYMLVAQGEVELTVSGHVYELSAGSAISFSAKEPHSYRNKGDCDVIAYFIELIP